MKLSMSMLAWYLREHDPVCYIEDDAIGIKGLRFVLDDTRQLAPEYLYFCNAELFFGSEQYVGAYLMVNRHSMLLFMNSDYDVLLNAALSAFEFFTNLEGQLLNAASFNAPLRTFMDIMEPVLENPFLIANLDGSFRLTTDFTGHRVDPLWAATAEKSMGNHPAVYAPYFDSEGRKITELSDKPRKVRNVYEGGAPVIMLYLQHNGESVGSIAILQENPDLTEMNMQLAPVLAQYCIRAEEFTSASGSIQSGSSLFRNLLEGKDIGKLNVERLGKGLRDSSWRLLQFRPANRTDQIARSALILNLRAQSDLYFPSVIDETCFAIISERDFQIRKNKGGLLFSIRGAALGISMPFSDLSSIPLRRQQAEFAWEQSGGMEGSYLCEDYACDYLLRSFRSLTMTTSLLHPALEVLQRYDEANQTELRKTLSEFLHQERNQLFTARAMHIHPNTLRYRIQRIKELTGLTLEEPEELKYLRLSDWIENSFRTS